MSNRDRKAASSQQCRVCEATVSTSGFAATSHQRSVGHIAGLISQGRIAEAQEIQVRADIDAKNRQTARLARGGGRVGEGDDSGPCVCPHGDKRVPGSWKGDCAGHNCAKCERAYEEFLAGGAGDW